jgi:CBS domain-containing protein
MTVAAILKHKGHRVITVEPAVSIAHVAEVLSDRGIGSVLVADRDGRLLGIVSERDIVHGLATHGARALGMTAEQLMTGALRFAHPGTTESEAMAMMTEGRFRHLPVVDHGELIGLVSIGDVVKSLIMQREQEVERLVAYVTGTG